MNNNYYSNIAFIATLLAFIVVTLGAYTRLKDAGLGCPDWPGCYGHFVVPKTQQALDSAQKRFPHQPVEPAKAWAEMVHRYFAGGLVLLIITLAIWSAFKRKQHLPLRIPLLLVACAIFQGLLGMWTVTLQLLPLVVMGHLLGGMTIASLLWWLTLSTRQTQINPSLRYLKPWVLGGLAIVFVQIFLGGWTSANYASIICPEFPFCHGLLFPPFDFKHAFNFLSPIGQNYQGGLLGVAARVTIQMTHRYFAFVTLTYVGSLALYLLFAKKTTSVRNIAGVLLLLLLAQFCFGVLNIVTLLYLPVAVTHNAIALLLLLTFVTLLRHLELKPFPIHHQTTYKSTSSIIGAS